MHLVTRKTKAAVFEHRDDFTGEVKIRKGDVEVSVSMEDLRGLVAESVRYDLATHVQKMKSGDLLRRIV
jgi:hypothetical protein